MDLNDLIILLHGIAPENLAEEWDEIGLHVGDLQANVRKGMLCIDLTEPVVTEAVNQKCNVIVSYHPPIFKPISALVSNDWKSRVLMQCVRRKIAVYSPHTALDNVRGGMTDWLCDGLGESWSRFPIKEHESKYHRFKVVTFVPHDDADRVRHAMQEAGAGWIGNYSGCSYNSEGFGTFLPEEGASPTIGVRGTFERVSELRVEMRCLGCDVGKVVQSIRQSHPYEEPAIDVYPLAPEMLPDDQSHGAGRIHLLKKPVTRKTLINRVKKHLGVKTLKVAMPVVENADTEHPGKIQSIAVCPGAGGSLFETYPGADAYLTGEMQHHQVLDLVQSGSMVILAGHTNTERPYLPVYRDRLAEATGKAVAWQVSKADRCPIEVR